MSEIGYASNNDTRKWYQKIIRIDKGNDYNNPRINLDLWILRASTMDYLRFSFDFEIALEGVIFVFSVPYFRVCIGRKFYHKYYSFGQIKTNAMKNRVY